MNRLFCRKYIGLIAALICVLPGQSKAQEVHDIGIQGGISTYLGDFNNTNIFYSPSPYFGAHYRYNFSDYNSLRFSANAGQIQGSSSNYSDYLPNVGSGIKFQELFFSADLKYEVNFLPFDPLSVRRRFFSPYLSTGISLYVYNGSLLPAIPFGGGVKFALGKRMTFGVEFQFSKTFTDNLDNYVNVSDSRSFIHNNDWFFTCGLVFSYRLKFGQKTCPAYL